MATIERSTTFQAPGEAGSTVQLKPRLENFIGGEWVAPVEGSYRENLTPATGQPFCEVPDSTPQDIEVALDAAHAAKDAWGEASTTERSSVLNAVADAIEQNLEMLAVAESWENGKPVCETLAADLPLAVDHFRYFADVIRAEEDGISELDHETVAYHFREPLGVVGQIIPFNFPLLSRTSARRWRSPTTRCTDWARACGAGTARGPTAWAVPSRPDACGPTASTCTPPTRRSAATRSRASAARITR
jgi:hypothetical protein